MIEFIFTIDYEIYGNGDGSLKEHILKPIERLIDIFKKFKTRFVPFIEVAELELIESEGTDDSINLVKKQLKKLYRMDYELGLHLHPQWYNALYKDSKWLLDYSEYNLCILPKDRIVQIIDRSIDYFRFVLEISDFTPFSFRAGNWLFQPTRTIASVLAERGIKVDSSVFKGGLQHQYSLDYRRALRNGYYWAFSDEVDVPDPNGSLLELPIYTKMVPFWRMLTAKRINLQQKSSSGSHARMKKLNRLFDFARFWYPMKLDFCRMAIDELILMMDSVIKEDQKNSTLYKPIVAIGHTKDLVDFNIVESFLAYLVQKGVSISTLKEVHNKCKITT